MSEKIDYFVSFEVNFGQDTTRIYNKTISRDKPITTIGAIYNMEELICRHTQNAKGVKIINWQRFEK